MFRIHMAAGVTFIVALCSPATAQSVRYVRVNGPNNGNGQTWATAHNKLYKALDAATADPNITQIWIAQGTHTPNRSGNNRDDSFALKPDVTLYGGFTGSETQLSQRDPVAHPTILSGDIQNNDGTPGTFTNIADNSRHVLTALSFPAGNSVATLDGLTIRSGNADFPSDQLLGGGGLFIQSGRVAIINCTFTGNAAGINQPAVGGFGGAIYNYGGSLDANGVTFAGNRGDSGGAFGLRDVNGSAVHAAFINCQFLNNTALNQTGGAVWTGVGPFDSVERDLLFDHCTFDNNRAQYGGAIIEQNVKHVKIVDCTFKNNRAFVVGGAMWHSQTGGPDQEPIAITRCSFINNHASDHGGALFFTAVAKVITSCTFLGNKADTGIGGAIRCGPQFGTSGGVGNMTLANCLFSGNTSVLGGAVGALREPLTRVVNCTFANNADATLSGGIYSEALTLEIDNTIFWNNHSAPGSSTQSAQVFQNAGFGPLFVDHSCVQGLDGSFGGIGNIGVDPLFADADGADNLLGTSDDNLRVQNGSPTVNVGDAAALPADSADLDNDGNTSESLPRDLDNLARFAERNIDMGAYEMPVPLAVGDINGDGNVDTDDLVLVITAWGDCPQPCPAYCPPDVNHNCVVNIDDLVLLITHWG